MIIGEGDSVNERVTVFVLVICMVFTLGFVSTLYVKITFTANKSLKEGEYTLCVAIIDPSTGKPGIKLGIEGIRPDGRYALDPVTVGK